jgi:hypothetical protein
MPYTVPYLGSAELWSFDNMVEEAFIVCILHGSSLRALLAHPGTMEVHPGATKALSSAVHIPVNAQPVLRIHEILVRIRIRRSIPLTNGSGSCYFRQWPFIFVSDFQDVKKNSKFLYFIKVHFTSLFKDKEVIKKSQNSRNQCFSYYSLTNPGGPKTYGSGSATLFTTQVSIIITLGTELVKLVGTEPESHD